MSFAPVRTLADLESLDQEQIVEGYRCYACEDIGWLVFEDGYVVLVIPCTECSEEVTLGDL
jgi:hypothetical protein